MGRRKKEAPDVHRRAIAEAAQRLFMERGAEKVSMDRIAEAAGYSKATLYVYFENKEEIVSVLVLESMRKLRDYIASALEPMPGREEETTKKRYQRICRAMVRYQEEFPYYFRMALERIPLDFDGGKAGEAGRATFQAGEEINGMMACFLKQGMDAGELRGDLQVIPVVFAFWGMLAGLLQLAREKEAYVEGCLSMTREEFLAYGFDLLYSSLTEKDGVK